ncbi:hypothetical protein B0J14DRAFT_487631, partial [Halenospora varia]
MGTHSYDRQSSGVLTPGVYVPTIAFFDALTEELDTSTIARHATRLAKAGITGLATRDSGGECAQLSFAGGAAITKGTRNA